MPRLLGALLCWLAVAAQGATVRTAPRACEGVIDAEAGGSKRSVAMRHGEAELDLSGAKLWRLTLTSERCWAAPVIASGDSVLIPVWPKRTISGELTAGPPSLTLHFESEGGVPPSDTACRVDGRRFSCDVPEAALDLRLDVPGFAPVRLWRVDAADAGKIALHPGASVAGFITRDDGGGLADSTIELTGGDTAIQRVKADSRGFFQFTSVPPGTYTVSARRPKGAPTRERGIRVVGVLETLLRRPLLLAGFATLRAAIHPPVTPAGHPWTVDLKRVDFARNARLPFARGAATAVGLWERGGLERETYNVQVADELGAVYFERDVDVDADLKELAIAVDTIPLEGRIRLGGQPLHASIAFVSSTANVAVESGDDGAFYGSLPHEGRYELRIKPKSARFQALQRHIDVRRSSSGVASVDVDLPSGRVKGVVIDAHEKPLSNASVSVLRGTTYAGEAFSDEAGEFEVVGLEPGGVTVIADHGKKQSAPYTYDAAAEPAPLTIVINDARNVHGRILSSGGGIAGAEIRYLDGMFANKTVSGPGGEYSFQTASASPSLTVVVATPGFPVKIVRLRVPAPGESADIVVSSVAGTLSIVPPPGGQWPVVVHGDCVVALSQLLLPRAAPGPPPEVRGDRFVIDVEPGEYAVCPAGAANERCVRRVVPPQGDALADLRPR